MDVHPKAKPAILTLDLEDYRRYELELRGEPSTWGFLDEVSRQLDLALEAFDACHAKSTVFAEARMATSLPARKIASIVAKHELGCHGYAHHRVDRMLPDQFRMDVDRAKKSLEDHASVSVVSFRAPYFSADGCDPWFGETLAENGFRWDSSRRVSGAERPVAGWFPLNGSDGAVREVPLPSVGFGTKRLTIIGGTYFRLLPLATIRLLLERAESDGFIPMVYLHPYDFDPDAPPVRFGRTPQLVARLGDLVRRAGRESVGEKLSALSYRFRFGPLSTVASERIGVLPWWSPDSG